MIIKVFKKDIEMVLALIAAVADAAADNDQYTFFGFMGVASALVFASKSNDSNPRPRSCLRNR